MLTQDVVLAALERLSQYLGERGLTGEIDLLGGTAMMLTFQARQATKDVDAIFAPVKEIREAAKHVAAELDLEEDWLNDAAKGFASPTGDFWDAPLPQFLNLRVLAPTAEYMLAMKVISARSAAGSERGDKADIALLVSRLGLQSSDEVMRIVSRYYPDSHVPPRSIYLVDEIMEERSTL